VQMVMFAPDHYLNVSDSSKGDEFRLRLRLCWTKSDIYGFNPQFALSNAGNFEVLKIDGSLLGGVTFFSLSETFAEANTLWGAAAVRKNPHNRFDISLKGSQFASVSYNFLRTRARLAILHGDNISFKTSPLSDNMRAQSQFGDCKVHYEGIHHAQLGRIGLRELRRTWIRSKPRSRRFDGVGDEGAGQSDASNNLFYQWRISLPSQNPAKDDMLAGLVMLISYRWLAVTASYTQGYGPLDIILGQRP